MSRVQLAHNVSDIDQAVEFYGKLFDAEPAKRRPGYANFAIENRPLKLVLIENDGSPGTLNHLGVEVESTDEVARATERFGALGMETAVEDSVECCYARQDKVWVKDPDNAPWEIYTVLADAEAPVTGIDKTLEECGSACCTSAAVSIGGDASMSDSPKEVLFVCVHNSGRSRMAEAFFNAEMKRRGISEYRATSAGTAPTDSANPSVVAVMDEVGLSIPNTPGRLLTPALTENAIKFVSMGCGDAEACPMRLHGDMEDWELVDPKGRSVEEVREIREDVRQLRLPPKSRQLLCGFVGCG